MSWLTPLRADGRVSTPPEDTRREKENLSSEFYLLNRPSAAHAPLCELTIRVEINKSEKKIIWLRISYWVGAIADGLGTLRILFPKFAHGVEYRYALGLGASLMLGWTILLIWADRKPIERKGVLLLTAFPVVSGLLLAELYSVISGIISFERMLPTGLFLIGLIILFSYSYFNARTKSDE